MGGSEYINKLNSEKFDFQGIKNLKKYLNENGIKHDDYKSSCD